MSENKAEEKEKRVVYVPLLLKDLQSLHVLKKNDKGEPCYETHNGDEYVLVDVEILGCADTFWFEGEKWQVGLGGDSVAPCDRFCLEAMFMSDIYDEMLEEVLDKEKRKEHYFVMNALREIGSIGNAKHILLEISARFDSFDSFCLKKGFDVEKEEDKEEEDENDVYDCAAFLIEKTMKIKEALYPNAIVNVTIRGIDEDGKELFFSAL